MQKPSILIVNDDGIQAPGLKHLWNSLKDFCEPYIVAPSSDQSGVGLSVTLRNPLHVESVPWLENTPAWQVSGTPTDCVRMALNVILKKTPDLIVSGINKGTNSGRNLLYSGTVGGIIEGAMRGIPGIAFSSESYTNPEYSTFEPEIFPLVEYLLSHPLPKGSFLNVTFPSLSKGCDKVGHKGCRLARQGMSYFKEQPLKGVHPEGREYYWMGGINEEHEEHEESDVHLLKSGYITVVPVQVKELTDISSLETRKKLFDTRFQLR